VHAALDRERGGLEQLGPVVDRIERDEVGDAARDADGDEAVELPLVLLRQRDPLLVREAPEDLGGDRRAEVGVQLGEAFLEHDLSLALHESAAGRSKSAELTRMGHATGSTR
jgi:hypothetical protein